MSYHDALADLKAEFGKKKLLTPSDIAPYIDKSPSAQASMRSRKQFPMPKKEVGGRIYVSIYALARFIGEDDEIIVAPNPAAPKKSTKPTNKSSSGTDKTKPFRRAPSLGRTLTTFRARINETALRLHFQEALLANLEAIALDRSAKRGRKDKEQ